MHFDQQELKPYAEPVSAINLKQGSVYFFLNYIDDGMLFPTLEPMVFVGKDLESGDIEQVYFQDAESYQQGIRHDSAGDGNARFFSGAEKDTNHIFEYEFALDELIRCSLRRKQAASQK